MQLIMESDGTIRCLYTELIDLSVFGVQQIRRASFVEPTAEGFWQADLSPSGGPILGPFVCRSAAIKAESDWFEAAGLP
jgi:hypothetical protein